MARVTRGTPVVPDQGRIGDGFHPDADAGRGEPDEDEAIAERVRLDPGAGPLLGHEELRAAAAAAEMADAHGVLALRRRLRLTRFAFANRYRLPIDALHRWEFGLDEPDTAARTLLDLIAAIPDTVAATVATPREAEEAAAEP